MLSTILLERWPQFCRVKITFELLRTTSIVSTRNDSMRCFVNWIPLNTNVRSNQPTRVPWGVTLVSIGGYHENLVTFREQSCQVFNELKRCASIFLVFEYNKKAGKSVPVAQIGGKSPQNRPSPAHRHGKNKGKNRSLFLFFGPIFFR